MEDSTVKLIPYDYDVADEVFDSLFRCKGNQTETEDRLTEIPAASYQLVVSALEYIRWETHGKAHDIISMAIGVVEGLRNKQKMREWNRERSKNA